MLRFWLYLRILKDDRYEAQEQNAGAGAGEYRRHRQEEKEDTETDPISQLLGRLTDVSYCYRVNRPTGTKTDRDGNPAEFFRYTCKDYKGLELKYSGDTRLKRLKGLAKRDYLDNYRQEGDTVEAFNIKPDGETKDKGAA